jgi:type II secretory pathway pseudopilin PulG
MDTIERAIDTPASSSDAGFSLLESLVSMGLVLLLFSASIDSLQKASTLNKTVGNRNEMHASVRGATELMEQEIGQAGRVALPAVVTLAAGVAVGNNPVAVSSTDGLFVGAQVVVGTGEQTETVTLTQAAGGSITGVFKIAHAAGEQVKIFGGFSSGVVPPGGANGSTGTVLKMFGDINDDGQMVYVEYTCNTANGNLYRNMMPWNAGAKPPLTETMVLLNNIIPNPGNAACFTYQAQLVNGTTYVTGVAVTLSVRSQQIDQNTKNFLQATKTLLNVSPRNIFLLWSMASLGINNRLQPIPPSVQNLLLP